MERRFDKFVRDEPIDAKTLQSIVGGTFKDYRKKQVIFAQGQPADEVFFVEKGEVRLSVVSRQGKEAVVTILSLGNFFGEGCLNGQTRRIATAKAMTDCCVLRMGREAMMDALRKDSRFSGMFIAHLLSRNQRVEEDLVDQLFNSSEKRLARLLLLLANFGKEGRPEPILTKISQGTLAAMIGTTRSRVSHFMNKFRELGLIDYNGSMEVHSSLLSVVLHDQPHIKT